MGRTHSQSIPALRNGCISLLGHEKPAPTVMVEAFSSLKTAVSPGAASFPVTDTCTTLRLLLTIRTFFMPPDSSPRRGFPGIVGNTGPAFRDSTSNGATG